jgi:hypothetical protein
VRYEVAPHHLVDGRPRARELNLEAAQPFAGDDQLMAGTLRDNGGVADDAAPEEREQRLVQLVRRHAVLVLAVGGQ